MPTQTQPNRSTTLCGMGAPRTSSSDGSGVLALGRYNTRACVTLSSGCEVRHHVLLVSGAQLLELRLRTNRMDRKCWLAIIMKSWRGRYLCMRLKLGNMTFAVPEVLRKTPSDWSMAERSIQCSSCHIAARRMRSSMFRSHEALSPAKSTVQSVC